MCPGFLQTSYSQVVLLGDSLFERASFIEDGYSLQSALEMREYMALFGNLSIAQNSLY